LNYWGVGGDSNGAGFYNADAIQASPLAEMLSFDEEQNSWKFVPSQEIVTQLQNNLAELRRSLEARRNKKPEETGSDAPAESPKPPESD
ncbi:MAG TPA: hypothetical protein VLA12_03115, partial [Planctomycetaceae bacterium]|nr:hypothetical protein [Planctomycetaceae bacterium]